MEEWDDDEKFNKYFAQEAEKIDKRLEEISKVIKIKQAEFTKKPFLVRKYHIIAWFIICPFYKIKLRIHDWRNAKQSPYTMVDDYK
jgi:hypothetical protein